jgi:hypothetical protein
MAANPYIARARAPSPSTTAPALSAARELPPNLTDTPSDARIEETFAGFAGAVAITAFFVFVAQVVALTQEGLDHNRGRLHALGISLGLAAVCGPWEIFRRTRRTSLVFSSRGIGLYRRGQLEQVVGAGQITWYRLSFLNSVRELFLFGVFAGIGSCGALAVGGSVAQSGGADLGTALIILGMGLGGGIALAGSIWSRWFCRHYIVPKGRGSETVVLAKSALDRLGVLKVSGIGMGF